MRVSRLLAPITVLGPGRRAGLWVQGCTLACAGCASADTWDAGGGLSMEPAAVARQLLDVVAAEGLDGLTVTGGEPFQQPDDVLQVLELVRAERGPDFDVLIFTGYQAAAARRISPALMGAADAVVAGRYRQDLPSPLPLTATSNQQVVLREGPNRDRYEQWLAGTGQRRLQVTAQDGDLFVVGMPAGGDLDRLAAALTERGIELSGVSWRS